jgi:anti-anti-sigma factor
MVILDRKPEAGGLDVQLEHEGGAGVIRAWGELEIASAKAFETELRRAIRVSSSGVILDLGGVTFIDSTGLRVLISAATLSHTCGHELRVLCASAQVKYAIETSGVEDLLPLAD